LTSDVRPVNNHALTVSQAPQLNPGRIEKARLAANMSRNDLAFAVRRATGGRLKPTDQAIKRWANGTHTPREGAIAAIAIATGKDISYFYEQDAGDDDEEADLLRDLEQLPADLRLRIVRALRRRSALA
jgi:transcriptional regulator with XRE-family HTH domain